MLLDETCSCEFETETEECICFGRVTPPKVKCRACVQGKHLLEPKQGLTLIADSDNAAF